MSKIWPFPGGCIQTGPFAGMIANISATAPDDTYENVTVGDFLSYGPRCVNRDISNALGQNWANDSMIADLLSNPLYQTNIGDWQTQLQSTGTDTVGFYGLHAYGHMTLNGDPSTDVRRTVIFRKKEKNLPKKTYCGVFC